MINKPFIINIVFLSLIIFNPVASKEKISCEDAMKITSIEYNNTNTILESFLNDPFIDMESKSIENIINGLNNKRYFISTNKILTVEKNKYMPSCYTTKIKFHLNNKERELAQSTFNAVILSDNRVPTKMKLTVADILTDSKWKGLSIIFNKNRKKILSYKLLSSKNNNKFYIKKSLMVLCSINCKKIINKNPKGNYFSKKSEDEKIANISVLLMNLKLEQDILKNKIKKHEQDEKVNREDVSTLFLTNNKKQDYRIITSEDGKLLRISSDIALKRQNYLPDYTKCSDAGGWFMKNIPEDKRLDESFLVVENNDIKKCKYIGGQWNVLPTDRRKSYFIEVNIK